MIGDRKKRFKEEMRIVKDKVPLSRLRKGLIKLFWAISKPLVRVTWCFPICSKISYKSNVDFEVVISTSDFVTARILLKRFDF